MKHLRRGVLLTCTLALIALEVLIQLDWSLTTARQVDQLQVAFEMSREIKAHNPQKGHQLLIEYLGPTETRLREIQLKKTIFCLGLLLTYVLFLAVVLPSRAQMREGWAKLKQRRATATAAKGVGEVG